MKPTKKHRKSSLIAAGAALLAVMLTASACGANEEKPLNGSQGAEVTQPADATPTPEAGTDASEENSGNAESSTEPAATSAEPADPNSGGDSDSQNDAVVKAEGVYVGQIDTHSIEVSSDEGPLVLQVTDDFSSMLNELESDTKIKFEYIAKIEDGVTLLWLNKLEKL
ncbi:hypothetical protein [Paenibacillus sp. NEAU-GSW1]|uniref:hypothetical protein n=1 Tax=Paenibacillus sp. NEAU-GSW1 TaxID=2682486 RepID=UPI0012E2BFFC|nr:hypothetical protein [Paenibacillus sp. NEAU-GSW1]MUT68074.1 hypothetical protein [Paenibacillus sp. NEAU-GSW1]